MYQYYKGLIIREGGDGLKSDVIKKMYAEVGLVSSNQPQWQDEKYEICFKNSSWVFTVWDNEDMIAMVRVVSDKVMTATIQDLAVKEAYRGRGIGKKLVSLCLQKLPHGNWWVHTTPENYDFYKKCGFELSQISESSTLTYMGFTKARLEGHR
ncbi:GNAT family N-acetyltransferase [Inconstantimicrobium mannanitabidum]|uniref:N-acetyltransferase n=1 Tax=Inconstantimicrobium mannanitabidum TaxID=1604901 RepID=A0ACB5R9S3_9CLOT|nr:GNAT family N-acetyltransferase [Clostridium sp. TW13]GKX65932.1 N-acetyltransferase [Clostridium sp. TW13]